MTTEQIFAAVQNAYDQAAAAETQKPDFDWNRDYIRAEQAGREAAVKVVIDAGCDELTVFTVGEIVKK